MPRCNGLPDGPCPNNKCDSSVNLSQGDLMLCKHCSNVRFPAQAVTAANSVKSLETGNGPDKECMPGKSRDDANNVVIRQLPDLNSVADDKYDDVFIRSLNTIYQYSLRDIQDQLQKASMKVLTVLHKALCDKVGTELDKIFVNKDESLAADTDSDMTAPSMSEYQELLQVVADLTQRIRIWKVKVKHFSVKVVNW